MHTTRVGERVKATFSPCGGTVGGKEGVENSTTEELGEGPASFTAWITIEYVVLGISPVTFNVQILAPGVPIKTHVGAFVDEAKTLNEVSSSTSSQLIRAEVALICWAARPDGVLGGVGRVDTR